jgi:hypothetical protein
MALLNPNPPVRGSARALHPSRLRTAGRLAALFCCLLGCLTPRTALHAQAATAREYQLKAVFLFNFAQFVAWPPPAFAAPDAPLVIGVLGEDPFHKTLDDTVRGEKVEGHPIAIERYRRVDDLKTCHVLFVCRSEIAHLDQILARLKGQPVLTVGDVEGFAQRGGMIRFVNDNNKVRFRINVEAAKAANLTISSKLLRPADIVAPGKD